MNHSNQSVNSDEISTQSSLDGSLSFIEFSSLEFPSINKSSHDDESECIAEPDDEDKDESYESELSESELLSESEFIFMISEIKCNKIKF